MDPRVDHLVALAQVCFIWGDVRATTREQKLQAYEEGREGQGLAGRAGAPRVHQGQELTRATPGRRYTISSVRDVVSPKRAIANGGRSR
jgi:hypothetical protein